MEENFTGAGYDPVREKFKVEEIVKWSMEEMKCPGPVEFCNLISMLDRQTQDGSRHGTMDRIWQMIQRQKIEKHRRELARG